MEVMVSAYSCNIDILAPRGPVLTLNDMIKHLGLTPGSKISELENCVLLFKKAIYIKIHKAAYEFISDNPLLCENLNIKTAASPGNSIRLMNDEKTIMITSECINNWAHLTNLLEYFDEINIIVKNFNRIFEQLRGNISRNKMITINKSMIKTCKVSDKLIEILTHKYPGIDSGYVNIPGYTNLNAKLNGSEIMFDNTSPPPEITKFLQFILNEYKLMFETVIIT